MSKPKLIIISGMPGVGKTTLAKKLSEEFNIPYISKDDIKELLYSLDGEGPEWVSKLGTVSYDIMYRLAEKLIEKGNSIILESNFNQKSLPHLKKFVGKTEIIQYYCFADPKLVFDRFHTRHYSGNRHPKHVVWETFEEFKEHNKGLNFKLDLPGKLIEVDMNDFRKVDLDSIVK